MIMTRKTIFAAALALFFLLPAATRAEGDIDCVKAYEQAVHPTWLIVSDILRFKTMFDNYDHLCTTYYPDDIAALQPASDILRAQTNRDVKNAERVIRVLFNDALPDAVSPACHDDKAARERVQKNLLSAMKTQSKTVSARLEKSALTIRNPEEDLKLCRDLKPLKKKVEKALGPELANPLFEMSVANSKFITRDARQRKGALLQYREILKTLD
jgi:hypothetical protein